MKKLILLLSAVLMISLVSCSEDSTTSNDDTKVKESTNKESSDSEEKNLSKFENTEELDFSEVSYVASETEKNEKLEKAIAKAFDLTEDVPDFRYFYNNIDLNGDDKKETFVFLVGSIFSGSGGSTGIIFSQENDEYKTVSKFSLVRNPIIISENKTNGWKNIIMHVSGGGVKPFFAVLKHNGEKYPSNPSVQPGLEDDTKVKGTAIIADDLTKNHGITY
ncbi:hypothetical protein [Dethiothermospora halolimnae]|uniref:hypothetical protein n=1 Tax=Dethiothermospora halolimnae TaxID=3114390 RepID=UPI003CCBC6F2